MPTNTKTTAQGAVPQQHETLAAALAAFQGEMPVVPKDKTATVPMKSGGRYSYTYADLAAVTAAATPVLARHGLSFSCSPGRDEHGWVLIGSLLHTSGESVTGILPLVAGGPQEMGSAITYARRYLLGALSGIVTDDDDDGQRAQEQHRAQQQPEQRQQQRRPQQRRQQQRPPEQQAQPEPDTAAAAALRGDVLAIVDGFEPGTDRDDALRALHQRAQQASVLDVHVPLPEPWRDDPDTTHVPLRSLIAGARGMTISAGEQQQQGETDADPWGSTQPGADVQEV